MGFKYWYEGLIFVIVFGALIAIPCSLIAMIGSKMFNDLGNFPTKAAQIQSSACWKVLLIEIVSFALFAVFLHIFS